MLCKEFWKILMTIKGRAQVLLLLTMYTIPD
jgi:hypothetical protein